MLDETLRSEKGRDNKSLQLSPKALRRLSAPLR